MRRSWGAAEAGALRAAVQGGGKASQDATLSPTSANARAKMAQQQKVRFKYTHIYNHPPIIIHAGLTCSVPSAGPQAIAQELLATERAYVAKLRALAFHWRRPLHLWAEEQQARRPSLSPRPYHLGHAQHTAHRTPQKNEIYAYSSSFVLLSVLLSQSYDKAEDRFLLLLR